MLKELIRYYDIMISRHTGKTPKGPLFLYLEITRKCNLKCEFCNIWMVGKKNPELFRKEMTKEKIFEIVDDAADMGVKIVDIDGGEPLLRKEVYEIIRRIEKNGMTSLVATNGTLLTRNVVKKLIDSNLSTVLVSLDSHIPEIHDEVRGVRETFKKARNGIKFLRELGKNNLKIGISSLVTSKNIELTKVAKLAKSLDVDMIRFLPYHLIYPHNLYSSQNEKLFIDDERKLKILENEIENLLEYAKANGLLTNSEKFLKGIPEYFRGKKIVNKCYAGYLFCDINCYGEVMPCLLHSRSRINLGEKSFKDFWNSDEFKNARDKIRKSRCENCWHSCYIEPNIRMSLFYILKNWKDVYQEIRSYLNV